MNKKIHRSALIVSVLFLILSACTSSSTSKQIATGTLDTSFGISGIVSISNAINTTFNNIIKDEDGRYLLTGTNNQNIAVWRVSSEGELDPTFSNNGMFEYDGGGTIEAIYQLLLQSDGKIIAIGTSHDGVDRYMTVLRLNDTGTLDNSFGTNGVVLYGAGTTSDTGYGGMIDSSGRLVVTGISSSGGNDMAIWRYDSSGNLDPTFGSGGVVLDGSTLSTDNGRNIVENADGKYLIIGGGDSDAIIWRYNADGTPDTSYGNNGFTRYDNGGYDSVGPYHLSSNGTLTVAGSSHNGTDHDMLMLQYDASGTLVSTFGTGGVVRYHGGVGYDGASGLKIDTAGNFVLTGASENATDRDLIVWRYNKDGAVDSGFGTNGIVLYNHGNTTDERGNALLIESNGNIIVAGLVDNTSDGTIDGAILRFK